MSKSGSFSLQMSLATAPTTAGVKKHVHKGCLWSLSISLSDPMGFSRMALGVNETTPPGKEKMINRSDLLKIQKAQESHPEDTLL